MTELHGSAEKSTKEEKMKGTEKEDRQNKGEGKKMGATNKSQKKVGNFQYLYTLSRCIFGYRSPHQGIAMVQ